MRILSFRVHSLLAGILLASACAGAYAATYQVRVPINPTVAGGTSGTSSGSVTAASGIVYNQAAPGLSGYGLTLGQVTLGTLCGSSSQTCLDAAFTL